MTMGIVLSQEDDAMSRDRIASDLVIGDGVTREAKGWWVESQCFLNHHTGVGKVAQVVNLSPQHIASPQATSRVPTPTRLAMTIQ
jgi:hypothetical protein